MDSQYPEECLKLRSEFQTFPLSSKLIELGISANLGAKISATDIEKSISANLEANISVMDVEKSFSGDLDAKIRVSDKEKAMTVPDNLKCPVCKELIKDAVMCPEYVCEMCDNCARKDLKTISKCPVCFEIISPDELIPNRKTRLAVEKFRNSLTISQLVTLINENKRFFYTEKGSEQENVLEDEPQMFEKDFEMDLPFYGCTSTPVKTQSQKLLTEEDLSVLSKNEDAHRIINEQYAVSKSSADFCGQVFFCDEKLKEHETEQLQPLEYKIVPFFVPKIGSPKPINGINLKQENLLADEDYELEKDFEMEFEKDFEMKFEEDFEMQPLEYKMVPFFVPKNGPPEEPETGNNFRKKIEKASLPKLKGVWKKSRQQQRRKRYVKALWSKK